MKKSVLTACIMLLAVCAAFLCPFTASATDASVLHAVYDSTNLHGSVEPITLTTSCDGEAVAVLVVSTWHPVNLSEDDWQLAGAYQAEAANPVSGIYTFVYYKTVIDAASVTISGTDNFYAALMLHTGYRSISLTSSSTPKSRGVYVFSNCNISGVTSDPTLFFWSTSSFDDGSASPVFTCSADNVVSAFSSEAFLQAFYSENASDPVTFSIPGRAHYVACSVFTFTDPAPVSGSEDDSDETSKGILANVRAIFSRVKDLPINIAEKLSSSFSDLKEGITGKLNEVKQGILEIADKIGNKLKELFVPDELTAIEDIKATVNEKFPFIAQLGDIFDGLFNFDDESTPPTFTFSWMGAEASVIDFAPFVSLRTPIQVIIALFVWIRFVMWLIDFVPKLLGGIGG
jgi:hypothetical protein